MKIEDQLAAIRASIAKINAIIAFSPECTGELEKNLRMQVELITEVLNGEY